ncbi:ZrgA family zinc uptake protein [Pseudocolwellia sp. HL-MZ19]|uniref:ZrgA family zinc uptake protein n=1 Tax=Pseudocolwellia sp. HL-MZ19 TaxID=3400846 RepID=UPI003CF93176
MANEHSSNQHAAHIHGEAELTLAVESNTLFINFLTPADSLLSFEHKAESADEVRKIEDTRTKLSRIETILTLSNSKCTLNNNENNLNTLLAKESHSPANAHHHHEHAEHTELNFSYTLVCEELSEVNTATINLFEHFKEINKISTLWISDKGQGATTLTPKNNTLKWK